MIDIHTHILAGLDDGPKQWADAITLAKQASASGITRVVATPHYQFDNRLTGAEQVQAKVKILQALLQAHDIDLAVYPGHEVYVSTSRSEALQAARFATLNETGRYVLLEMPTEHVPPDLDEIIFAFTVKGITPIIAHPERNRQVRDNPNLAIKFIESGALTQVNACSLMGKYGSRTKRTAEIMILNNMAHFLASDMHCPRTRPPILATAWRKAVTLVGAEKADSLVSINPRKVLNGFGISVESPERYRSFFGFLRSRA